MITIKKALTESRERDLKRRRLILQHGRTRIHITRDEALELLDGLIRALTVKVPK